MLEHVALLVDGRVLVDETGTLPVLPPVAAGEQERALAEILKLVGADIPVAPTAQLEDGRLVHFVGVRDAAPGETTPRRAFVSPGALPDATLASVVRRAVAEFDPAQSPGKRPDWFRPGWFDLIEAWIDAVLEPTGRHRRGPVEPFRLWSISAVVGVHTDTGVLWCKAPCAHFRAEARIHSAVARLFPALVPELVAVEATEGWLLMEPMTGVEQTDGGAIELAGRWAAAQQAALPHVSTLLSAGLQRRDVESTIAAFDHLLTMSAELSLLSSNELRAIRDALESVVGLTREFWGAGIPDTLAHGDLHLGNVAWDGQTLRIFDWTDGCVSHPFLDAGHLASFTDPAAVTAVWTTYADAWRTAFPDVDVDRVMELAPLADLVFQTVTFDEIAKATEAQSAWELGGVVASNLRRLPGVLAALR